ncbi:MAG: exodeoxyribonuclease III [Porticoccaceae bacterium]|nr:exodeoxyribonuclease III [Porticoccaceae bacterium]
MSQNIKLISFNVNGLRARLNQLNTIINQHQPDIIGLQETKVSNEEFPFSDIEALGYKASIHGQKGHYGVAFLTKITPSNIQCGFPTDSEDSQRRMIHAQFDVNGHILHLINCYFPQGEGRAHPTKFPAKQKFYADLLEYLDTNFSADDAVVVMGDMNVAHKDADVGIKPENAKRWLKTGKSAFLPEEREWLQALLNWGLIDSYRADNPENETYSWFDYRSKGFDQEPKRGLRIDLLLASPAAMALRTDTGIDLEARGHEKPSDHCPIWIDLLL